MNASRVLVEVAAGRSLTAALAAAFARSPELTREQRGAIQDICYGALRHRGRLDAMLAQLLTRPVSDEALTALLRAALYQLVHTRAAPHAIVDHAVDAAAGLGLARARGLVNAVLRGYLRRPDAIDAAAASQPEGRYSYPRWWIDRVRRDWPAQWEAVLEAGNGHPPMTLRVNARRATRAECASRLDAAGIAAEPWGEDALMLAKPLPVERIPGFAEGHLSVQDAGAQLAAPALDAKPGMRVLDACAAPGGKTAHLLERADIDLLAIDSDAARLERVRQNLDRLGLAAELACADAGEPARWWNGRPFDRILLDVPCTASGVVRRHPDIKWLRREPDIAQFATRQSAMLDALWQTLAAGGKLLYATCSIFPDENAGQVAAFLGRHPDAVVARPDGTLTASGQLLPDAQHDGFYYALIEKRTPPA